MSDVLTTDGDLRRALLECAVMTADSLRKIKSGWDDERLKRWVLFDLGGFRFCRRRGMWTKDKREVSPELQLEAVLLIVLARDGAVTAEDPS